jgi:hypothetical protein
MKGVVPWLVPWARHAFLFFNEGYAGKACLLICVSGCEHIRETFQNVVKCVHIYTTFFF